MHTMKPRKATPAMPVCIQTAKSWPDAAMVQAKLNHSLLSGVLPVKGGAGSAHQAPRWSAR